MSKSSDQCRLATDVGEYRNFTGWILFKGTDAYVENADFDLHDSELGAWNIDFRSGVFVGGKAKHMHFHGGTWRSGTFSRGMFIRGEWLNGFFSSGSWIHGTWHGGEWHAGYDQLGDMHLDDPTHWQRDAEERCSLGLFTEGMMFMTLVFMEMGDDDG